MSEKFKAGFVALIGRPSVGKSTLLNKLVGYKTAIVSELPQTTRNTIRGIVNRPDRGQIVFLDTPGLHKSERQFNHYMVEKSREAMTDADVILYLIDLTRPIGEEEAEVLALIKQANKPLLIAFNKIDHQDSEKNRYSYMQFLAADMLEIKKVEISAAQGTNLDALITDLLELLPEGEALYETDFYTDQPPEFRIAEILREKTMHQLKQEVPHSVYVEVADLEQRGNKLWARCFIMAERETQKGMIIGKGGLTLRKIRIEALKELKEIFEKPVELDLQVKVDENWRKKDHRLQKLFL